MLERLGEHLLAAARVAVAGAPAPPQASSSPSKAVMCLRYPGVCGSPEGGRSRPCAGSLLPRLDAPGSGAPRRRGLGPQHGGRDGRGRVRGRRRTRSTRCSRSCARARARVGVAGSRSPTRSPRGSPASPSADARTVGGRPWRPPPHHFASSGSTCSWGACSSRTSSSTIRRRPRSCARGWRRARTRCAWSTTRSRSARACWSASRPASTRSSCAASSRRSRARWRPRSPTRRGWWPSSSGRRSTRSSGPRPACSAKELARLFGDESTAAVQHRCRR